MMVPLTFLATFETIGSIVGILITLITFITLIIKRPAQAFRNMIREESRAANSDLTTELKEINNKIYETNKRIDQVEQLLNKSDQTDLAIIRNTITHIYYKYRAIKTIPYYEKENVISLYKQYESMGGNSFIHQLYDEICTWTIE